MACTESALFWEALRQRDSQECINLLKQSSDPGSLLRSPCVSGKNRRCSYEKGPDIGQHPLSYIAMWMCGLRFAHLLDDFFATLNDIIPSIASEKDLAGCFPLNHILTEFSTLAQFEEYGSGTEELMFPSSFDTCLLCLIKANPTAVLYKTSDGLPIEIALRQKYSAKVILSLLENSPDSYNECTFNPLWIALENLCKETMEEVVEAVVAKYPDASRGYTDYIPLHFAIKQDASPKTILSILLDYPEAAEIQNNDGREYILHTYLKLHETSQELGASEVILGLNNAWHDAFKIPVPDKWSLLPLHWAIMNNIHSEVILAILNSCPYVAAIRDHISSWLPLHYAAAGCVSPEVMRALLDSYPQAVNKRVYKTIQGTQMSGWCCPIDLMQPYLPEASMQLLIEASSSTSNH